MTARAGDETERTAAKRKRRRKGRHGSLDMMRGANAVFSALYNRSLDRFAAGHEDDARAITSALAGLKGWIDRDGLLEVERLAVKAKEAASPSPKPQRDEDRK